MLILWANDDDDDDDDDDVDVDKVIDKDDLMSYNFQVSRVFVISVTCAGAVSMQLLSSTVAFRSLHFVQFRVQRQSCGVSSHLFIHNCSEFN